MYLKLQHFLQNKISEKGKKNIRYVLSLLLYGWLFILVLLPLTIGVELLLKSTWALAN